MKTLILGTCYIDPVAGAQRYDGRMVRLWTQLAQHLNPDCDVLLIDSASPVDVFDAVGDHGPRTEIMRLDDNVGHINTTGRDGWGRSFSIGVRKAIALGYESLAYIDADIIFTRPVGPIFEKMARVGVKVACPWDTTYGILENGLMFFSVPYLKESRLVERYDWDNRRRSDNPADIPEVVFEKLLEADLFTLPLRGLRDDHNRLTVNNIEHVFPYGGPDYLTHVRDFNVYLKALKMAGISLP